MHSLGQKLFWEDLQKRLVAGNLCLTPRLEPVPVRSPCRPPATRARSSRSSAPAAPKSAFA